MPDLPLHGEDHPTQAPPTEEPTGEQATTTQEPGQKTLEQIVSSHFAEES